MESKILLLENHIELVENKIFIEKNFIYKPYFQKEDNINEDFLKMMKEKELIEYSAVKRVPVDYYDKDLEYRRQCLNAYSIDHLCKCILFEIKDISNELNKYICVVIQYVDKANQQKLINSISTILNEKIGSVSLAKEDEAIALSGSKYNAMTPVFLRPTKEFEKYQIPIILSKRIASLNPPFFWLGGGEVDVKFGIDTRKFLTIFKPFIFDISD